MFLTGLDSTNLYLIKSISNGSSLEYILLNSAFLITILIFYYVSNSSYF